MHIKSNFEHLILKIKMFCIMKIAWTLETVKMGCERRAGDAIRLHSILRPEELHACP